MNHDDDPCFAAMFITKLNNSYWTVKLAIKMSCGVTTVCVCIRGGGGGFLLGCVPSLSHAEATQGLHNSMPSYIKPCKRL